MGGRPALQPLPCVLSPSHSPPCTVCPRLPSLGVLLSNQDPRADLGPPEPLPSYLPPCTKRDSPLFDSRNLPWRLGCVGPGGREKRAQNCQPLRRGRRPVGGAQRERGRVGSGGGGGQLSSLPSACTGLVAASEGTCRWDGALLAASRRPGAWRASAPRAAPGPGQPCHGGDGFL